MNKILYVVSSRIKVPTIKVIIVEKETNRYYHYKRHPYHKNLTKLNKQSTYNSTLITCDIHKALEHYENLMVKQIIDTKNYYIKNFINL